ncbi:MAG: hypothetical protein V7703_03490, partial [Hyphomicrobiales bacterium]
INGEVQRGRLVPFQTLHRNQSTLRHMFIHEEIDRRLKLAMDGDNQDDMRFGALQRVMEDYTTGKLITVAHQPYGKKKTAMWAKTSPAADEIWDIRVVDPSASLRVLGGFAAMDVFVALEWEFRENLDNGLNMPLWNKFIRRAKTKWETCLPNYVRLSGGKTSDYISKNTTDV